MRLSLKIWVGIFIGIMICGCGSPFNYEDFTNSDSYKTEKVFGEDSKQCDSEKNKHSNKIQGREFGFEGEHTGYLGCMRLKGWNKN